MRYPAQSPRTAGRVYILLVIFTFITFLIGAYGYEGLYVSLAVLFIALFKGYLVGDCFMGLGRLRGLWRWPVLIWLFIPATLISSAFYMASR